MSRIRKVISPQKLITYDVLISDTASSSDYFNITQLPSVFAAGKNAFLIGGSPYLKPRSRVLIEIVNVNGDTIFNTAVQVSAEGTARIVSVEIYENTVPGPYKLIVVGQATTVKDTGLAVPSTLDNVYTVRWIKDIAVDPTAKNTSPIRFINIPTIVSAIENQYLIPSSSFTQSIQPIDVQLYPRRESGVLRGYTITTSGSYTFNRDHVGGAISASISYYDSTLKITSQSIFGFPITRVINSTTAITDGVPMRIEDRTVELLNLYNSAPYTSSNFNITTSSVLLDYKKLQIFTTGSVSGSFAEIRIINLEPYSGEVVSIEVSAKPVGDAGDFKLLSKPPISVSEILTTGSLIGDISIGNLYSESINQINSNWYAGAESTTPSNNYFTYTSSLPLITASNKILDAIYPDVPVVTNQFISSSYFFGTIFNYEIFANSEYTLFFDAFYTKISGSTVLNYETGSLDVYLTNTISTDPLGQQIASFTTNTTTLQNYENQETNFYPAVPGSGSVGLRFVGRGGYWYLANISLKPAVEFSYNPDETTLIIPVTEYSDKSLIFKTQFFDLNNNSTVKYAISDPYYFTGSVSAGSTGCGGICVDVYTGSAATITPDYSGSFSGSFYGVAEYPPVTAPGNPSSGWILYTDTADGTLKAKNSAGVVRTIALP